MPPAFDRTAVKIMMSKEEEERMRHVKEKKEQRER